VNHLKDDSAPVFDEATQKMVFITRRPLDTGDTGQDYLIELPSVIPMSYAYKSGTANFMKHDSRGVWSLAIDRGGVISDGGLDVKELLRNEDYEQHGLWMWGLWFVCGLGLLVTKRYVKKHWMSMQMIHSLLGMFVMIATIIFAMKVADFDLSDGGFHNYLGTVFLFISILGSLTGFVASSVKKFYSGDKSWSVQEKGEIVGKIHRYAGYIMLLLGNITLATGIGHYFNDILAGDSRKSLGPLSLLTFVLLVAIFETIYRLRNRYSLRQIKTDESQKSKRRNFTAEDLDHAVQSGQKLCMYDNLVIDLADYIDLHPGGKFNLKHNIGRDITKFFNGAYILVND